MTGMPGPGILFVLDGASGAGKTTLAFALAKANPDLTFVPRHTTRMPRHCESDAQEYIFVSQEKFSRMISDGAFLEYRRYEFGMSYGLARKGVNTILEAGKSALGIINLGNVELLKRQCPNAVAILIGVSLETLRRRLIERGANTPAQIAERLANALAVEKNRPHYDFVVQNETDLDFTLNELSGIVDRCIAMEGVG